jgi:pimeloyl-ACP methyl ester carboxylesterase
VARQDVLRQSVVDHATLHGSHQEGDPVEIPVYFLHGAYDYTVSYTLAKSYYDQLDAPMKGFYTFTESAHSPLFEEPTRMREIMQADVLAGANGLADPGQLR